MKTKRQTKLENVLLPVAKRLNVNPSLITVLSILLMLGSAYSILNGELAQAALLFLTAALLDALDGLVARTHGRASRFGAFFDKTADRINDGLVLIAVILAGYVDLFLGISVLFVVLLASYMSEVIDSISGKKIAEAISFRPIRSVAVFFGLLSGELVIMIWILLFIGVWTTIYRFFKAKAVLN